MFTGTIMDNIRYGRLNATDEECAAAKLASAHSFIRRLPEGYNTVITGDSGNLSQGQRRLPRLCIWAMFMIPRRRLVVVLTTSYRARYG